MRLTFLGKATQGGGSPTLFATDRGTYVVQGWKVAGRHDSVEIPQRLLAHLEQGTYLGARLDDSGRGGFTLSGAPLTDGEALSQRIRRVRVVTVPHVDYTRWGLTVAEHNSAAGEDSRWQPRHLIDSDALAADDFWRFDDERVLFTVFEPGGRYAGGAATTDPVIVARCCAVRDVVWQTAIPHRDY
ncbi:MAG: DUF6879 family protein, partial [Pseudonocardiaceae bacterium]